MAYLLQSENRSDPWYREIHPKGSQGSPQPRRLKAINSGSKLGLWLHDSLVLVLGSGSELKQHTHYGEHTHAYATPHIQNKHTCYPPYNTHIKYHTHAHYYTDPAHTHTIHYTQYTHAQTHTIYTQHIITISHTCAIHYTSIELPCWKKGYYRCQS